MVAGIRVAGLGDLMGVLRSLAYLGDLEDDPALAVSIEELPEYWTARIPQVATHVSRFGYDSAATEGETAAELVALGPLTPSGAIGPHRPVNGKCQTRTKKRRRCPFDALAGMTVCAIHQRAPRWRCRRGTSGGAAAASAGVAVGDR